MRTGRLETHEDMSPRRGDNCNTPVSSSKELSEISKIDTLKALGAPKNRSA